MKFIIVEEESDSQGELYRMRAVIRGEGYKDDDVAMYGHNTISESRMTLFQVLSLWIKCGQYKVKFREDDYYLNPKTASMMKGYAEGWIGGRENNAGWGAEHPTVYVGVAPDGRVNT